MRSGRDAWVPAWSRVWDAAGREWTIPASEGDIECVKVLLRSGTDPSIKTDYDCAPLYWAASKGQTEILKLLIEAGAEKSPVSDQHTTPLDMALRANQSRPLTY